MTGVIATIPRLRFGDGSGAPLAGGSVTVYAAGTTTPENSWQDRALTILNTNPITLDALGSCVVWLDSAKTYKIVVKDAAGATLWTQDNIVGGGVDDSVELNAPLIQAALDQCEAAAAAAANSLAAAQAIASGSLVHSQEFTGVGPFTITGAFTGFTDAVINTAVVGLSVFGLAGATASYIGTAFPLTSASKVRLYYV